MDYLISLLGMSDLNEYELVFKLIMIILFASYGIMLISSQLKLIPNFGKLLGLSFYFLVTAMLMLFITSFHTNVPIDTWQFGAMLGAFVGASFASFSFKKKEFYLKIILFSIIGIGIGIYTTKFLV